MPQQRVSMAMVATRAGVSGQTVSRVANHSPKVDPTTRERVEHAMAELGYRPNRVARALRTGRSHTLGVVAQTLATIGNSHMLQAVADSAAARGYALTVVTVGMGGGIDEAFDRLREQGVDGAIVLNEATALARGATSAGLCLVVVDSPPGEHLTVVGTDHAAGARTATEYLLWAGHPTVHHLAGPADSYAAAQRERGWREALNAADIEAPEILRGDWSAASGYQQTQGMSVATALFVANDQMALGALRALADAGRRVPEDVAVIGFDDIADAAQFQPPLTTVQQDFDALGEQAVSRLVTLIEGGHPGDLHLEPRIVARASA